MNFERAAQRSLKAVSNAGGFLHIRPITALYLPPDYTGMYVKLRYGSESVVSHTVKSAVNPEWSSQSNEKKHLKNRYFRHVSKAPTFEDSGINSPFTEQDHLSREAKDNDLELRVMPMRTSGSLRLSVIGVKVNSKEELGVLHLPLADVICCCTENFDQENEQLTDAYVRWFPLTDPKWTDSVDFDVRSSQRSVHTEVEDSSIFTQNYTKCIKLAMWWELDKQNATYFSNPTNDDEGNDTSRNIAKSYLNADVNGISAAIIDSFRARELLSFAFTNIDLRVLVTKPKTWLGFAMGGIQVDHHDEAALEPVVLSPTPVAHPQPTIQFLAEKDNLKSKTNIDSFRHVAIQLEEMDLRIEESWMFDLWEMYSRLQKRHYAMQKSITRRSAGKSSDHVDILDWNRGFAANVTPSDQSNEISEAFNQTNRDKDDLEAEEKAAKKIYIDELMLGCVKLNISYTKSLRDKLDSPSVNNEKGHGKNSGISSHHRAEIFRCWSELGHDEDWTVAATRQSRSLPDIIAAIFPAISAAPVRVNGKALNNVFETWNELLVTLQNYYTKEMMMQLYKIIGSLDIVGNPTMVVNSLLKGARDFVVIPLREFLRSPKNPSRLGIGVAKGTLSLFSHFFSGIFGFVSNVSTCIYRYPCI